MSDPTEITKPIYDKIRKLRKQRNQADSELTKVLYRIKLIDLEISLLKDKLTSHEIQRAWQDD